MSPPAERPVPDDGAVEPPDGPHEWHRVLDPDALGEDRVTTVTAGRRSLCVTRSGDRYGALDNHCPHQGGPLGEGSIEGGWLRCPWHGYEYDMKTGECVGDRRLKLRSYDVIEKDGDLYVRAKTKG